MKNRTCTVEDCNRPHLAKGMCFMHYGRMKRSGTTDDPRPNGVMVDHPHYVRWRQLMTRGVLAPEWHDFWRYVADALPQPPNTRKMRRLDTGKPYGPGNFEWAKTPTREDTLVYLRDYHAANPGRARNAHFLKKYGISLAEYEAMYVEQEGRCAICRGEESRFIKRNRAGKRMLCVDHDHETGEARGLLCGDCNVALGAFRDDPDIIDKAISYLQYHNALAQEQENE